MNTNETARNLIERLCVGAHPRKQKSMRLIYDICVEQGEQGNGDYRISTIGKLAAARGGPGAGAIRNRSGEAYRAIIGIFAKRVGKTSRRVRDRVLDEADEVLEGITDPVVRTRINLLLAELRSMRGQLLAARHLANTRCTVTIEDRPTNLEERAPRRPTLTSMEVRALKTALSPVTLDHWGWTVDESGRVLSETGQTVFGAGFADAIRKVLEVQPEDQNGII